MIENELSSPSRAAKIKILFQLILVFDTEGNTWLTDHCLFQHLPRLTFNFSIIWSRVNYHGPCSWRPIKGWCDMSCTLISVTFAAGKYHSVCQAASKSLWLQIRATSKKLLTHCSTLRILPFPEGWCSRTKPHYCSLIWPEKRKWSHCPAQNWL